MSSSFHQLPFDFSLEHEFTFENFVPSPLDREAVAAMSAATGGESVIYIWGTPGSGKSHLLQAACRAHENAAYLPLGVYADYGAGILDGLEQLDLVCIDDLENIAGRRDWEEALFDLFNRMRDRGNRLFLAAAHSPRNLGCCLDDLKSRLGWGMVYQLHEPDDAGKIAALKLRAERGGMPLDDDVLNYILLRSARSMDGLFKVLARLDELSLAEKRRITIPFVKKIMGW